MSIHIYERTVSPIIFFYTSKRRKLQVHTILIYDKNISNTILQLPIAHKTREFKERAETKNLYVYIPKFLETEILLSNESAMYPSLLKSDFQRPCLFIHLSLTSDLAAAEAPPERNECKPKLS